MCCLHVVLLVPSFIFALLFIDAMCSHQSLPAATRNKSISATNYELTVSFLNESLVQERNETDLFTQFCIIRFPLNRLSSISKTTVELQRNG